MKPIPQVVQAFYPCAPGHLRSRPWWTKVLLEDGCLSCKRNDGTVFRVAGDEAWILRHAESMDVSNPIPAPMVRVGQIWARVDDDGSILALQLIGQTRLGLSVSIVSSPPEAVPGPIPGMCKFDESVLKSSWFLLFDAVCPWAAPWSPPQQTADR
jgi:hypothetical protein